MEVAAAAVLTIFLTLAKLVYFPLAMIAGYPFIGRKLHWRKLIAPAAITALALMLLLLWVRAASGLQVPPGANIPPASERIAAWTEQPMALVGLLYRTYVHHGPALLDSLFTFGWLNVGPNRSAQLLTFAALAAALLAGDSRAAAANSGVRLWLLAVGASVALLISVGIYLYCTPASADWIQGLQGRYFIPVMALLLVASVRQHAIFARARDYVPWLMIGANAVALSAILGAYYTF